MRSYKKYIWLMALGVMAALGGAAAIAGIPLFIRQDVDTADSTPAAKLKERAPDKKQQTILNEFYLKLHAMDSMKVGTVEGETSVKDLADSTNATSVHFLYSRNDSMAYYRIGSSEMISLKNAYIAIEHDVKKIFLSGPREIVSPVRLPADKEVHFFWNEGYEVRKRQETNGLTEISLTNPTHISCRELRISFDSAGLIRQSFRRISSDITPELAETDRLMNTEVRSWEVGKARAELMKLERYVIVSNGMVQASPSLKDYELLISNFNL
jgi:hypothetical protein